MELSGADLYLLDSTTLISKRGLFWIISTPVCGESLLIPSPIFLEAIREMDRAGSRDNEQK